MISQREEMADPTTAVNNRTRPYLRDRVRTKKCLDGLKVDAELIHAELRNADGTEPTDTPILTHKLSFDTLLGNSPFRIAKQHCYNQPHAKWRKKNSGIIVPVMQM